MQHDDRKSDGLDRLESDLADVFRGVSSARLFVSMSLASIALAGLFYLAIASLR